MSEPPQSRNAIAQALLAQGEGGSALPEFTIPPIDAYFSIFKLIILGVVVTFALIAIFFGPLVAAKIIVAIAFLKMAILAAIVVFFRKTILVNLMELEEMGYLLQQETMVGCVEARQGLNLIQSKVLAAAHPKEVAAARDLFKYAQPLITMLMKKEKSKLNWAMFGFKVAKDAVNIIRQRGANELQYASQFDFVAYAQLRREIVEERLKSILDLNDPAVLWESMRYSVLSGGKRLRALLCLAGAEAVTSQAQAHEIALSCACAIELVHAMSLIHDDLPCMDNDDFRRGKPTNHKVFGEAIALLAGDALLMHANDILIEQTPKHVDRAKLLDVVAELARAAGAKGMVAGQIDDLTFTGSTDGKPANQVSALSTKSDIAGLPNPLAQSISSDSSAKIDASTIELIHKRKTGALITFSIWSGAKLSGADEVQLSGLRRVGEMLGLAFQITDDLLDVTGDIKTLGKTPGKDEASKKATWVRVFGQDGAREKLAQLESEGDDLLSSLPLQNASLPALSALLKYAIHRVN